MGRHLETIQSGQLRWLTYDQLIVLMHSFSYLVNGRAGLIAQLVELEFSFSKSTTNKIYRLL